MNGVRIVNTLEVEFFQKKLLSYVIFDAFSYSEIRGKKFQIFSKILAIISICTICKIVICI